MLVSSHHTPVIAQAKFIADRIDYTAGGRLDSEKVAPKSFTVYPAENGVTLVIIYRRPDFLPPFNRCGLR
jgi:hypothetical protein